MNALALEPSPLGNSILDKWPSNVDMKIIDPGVVFYEDMKDADGNKVGGNVLVQKAALDKMAASMEGKPIINWDHRSVKPNEYNKGTFQGIIGKPYYNSQTGWYHAPGYVWDEATKRNIQNGYSISCAYTVSEWAQGGTYHKVPYEQEVVDGSYTHIAVVSTPRYEGARIELLNSAKGENMGFMNIFKKDKPSEKIQIDVETSTVVVDGIGEKSIQALMNSYVETHPQKVQFDDSHVFTLKDGRQVTMAELKNSALQNADDQKLEKAHEDGEHKGDKKDNCSMCNSSASHEPTNLKEKASSLPKTYNSDKEKEEEERKNAEEAEKKKESEERRNAAANAAKLDEMRNKSRQIQMPKIQSTADLMQEGSARYGSAKPVAVTK